MTDLILFRIILRKMIIHKSLIPLKLPNWQNCCMLKILYTVNSLQFIKKHKFISLDSYKYFILYPILFFNFYNILIFFIYRFIVCAHS